MPFGLSPELKPIGFMYGLIIILLLGYLWYSGRWKQWIGGVLLAISAALGFLVFSPVAPYQFQALVLRDVQGLGGPLIAGAAGLTVVLLLVLLLGRFFCGYACPVGVVQEIAYSAPVPKLRPLKKTLFMAVRGAFLLLFLAMAFLFSASLLAYFGIFDFFHLAATTGSVVFLLILLVSLVFYRPFCRLVCPYGCLLSLAAAKSFLRLHRTSACIECKACEKACPADEAKREDAKAECYLCGRCLAVCPEKGALAYGRKPPQGT